MNETLIFGRGDIAADAETISDVIKMCGCRRRRGGGGNLKGTMASFSGVWNRCFLRSNSPRFKA